MKLFWKFALPVAIAYLVSFALAYFRKHDLDPHRLFTLGFVRDIQHCMRAEGGFKPISLDFTLFVLVSVPTILVILNFLAVGVYFQPPRLTRDLDRTITKLARPQGKPPLGETAIRVYQHSPTLVSISSSPDLALPPQWFKDNEKAIEAGAHIDIKEIRERAPGIVAIEFSRERKDIAASVFIEFSSGALRDISVGAKKGQMYWYACHVPGSDEIRIGHTNNPLQRIKDHKSSNRGMRFYKRKDGRECVFKETPEVNESSVFAMFDHLRIDSDASFFRAEAELIDFLNEYEDI